MGYQPPFENSAKVVSLVADIAELVGQVTIFEGLDPNPTLRRENRIRTIHSSLLIENNALTIEQVTAVLGGHHILAPPKDIREVQNAYEAYDVAAEFDPYSLDDLLKAHGLLMDGLVKHPGCLRNDDVGVYAGDVLIHPGTPWRYVPQVMKDLFEWLGTSPDHPLVKGSVFHYEFEFIHPFIDGNGRTGRLWHSLILRKWRPVFAWIPVETLIHRNQQQYYDALLDAGKAADSTAFVEFMLETIRDALMDAREQQNSPEGKATFAIPRGKQPPVDGQAMASVGERWTSDGQAMTSDRKALVLGLVDANGSITSTDVAHLLGLSKPRARAVLQGLVRDGLLTKNGNGRYTFYTKANG